MHNFWINSSFFVTVLVASSLAVPVMQLIYPNSAPKEEKTIELQCGVPQGR